MIKIRNIKESDIKSVSAIHKECWQVAYKGLLPQTYLDSLTQDSFAKRWTTGLTVNSDVIRLVALEKSQPIGFIVGLENRTPEKCPDASSEIWALYVHPHHWKKGTGEALIRKFLSTVPGPVLVWVLGSNVRGRSFYEAMGGELISAQQDFEVEGRKFPEVGYIFR